MDWFYLTTTGTCSPQKSLTPIIKANEDATVANLIFSDTWPKLFEKLKDVLSLNISRLKTEDYPYTITQDAKNQKQFKIKFDFKKDIIMDDILIATINIIDSPEDEFNLNPKEFTYALTLYCVPPTTYLLCKKK